MAPLQGIILQAGGKTFAFRGNAEVSSGVRTGFILDGSGSSWSALFTGLADSIPGLDWELREGIYLDLGGGEHIVEVEATGWVGSDLTFGGVEGADPLTQLNVLEHTLVNTQIHSFNAATLEFGEYSQQGMYSPLKVVIEDPRVAYSANEPGSFDINFVAIETATFDSSTFMDALSLTG